MNTNLPLVPRTSDGPTWSNGWAATGAHLDMIAKQYKNGTRTGKKGVKNGLERGPKRVLNGKKPESRQILQFGTAWNGRSSPFHIFPAVFGPFRLVFHPFFMILARNGKKTGAQKWTNGKGKNAFLSRFFPIPVFSRCLPGTSLAPTSSPRASPNAVSLVLLPWGDPIAYEARVNSTLSGSGDQKTQ